MYGIAGVQLWPGTLRYRCRVPSSDNTTLPWVWDEENFCNPDQNGTCGAFGKCEVSLVPLQPPNCPFRCIHPLPVSFLDVTK